jgi:hypothetical protein
VVLIIPVYTASTEPLVLTIDNTKINRSKRTIKMRFMQQGKLGAI